MPHVRPPPPPMLQTAGPARLPAPTASSASARGDGQTGAAVEARKFEALLLRELLVASLPAGQGAFGGRGLAADTWRSMLTDSIGQAWSEAGGVGIAATIEQHLTTRAVAADGSQRE